MWCSPFRPRGARRALTLSARTPNSFCRGSTSFRRRSRSGAAELSLAAAAASAPAAQPQIPGLGQSTSRHSDASIASEVWSELNQGEGAPVVALIREQHDEMRERMDRLELGLEAMRSQMSSMLETMRYG